MSRYLEPDEALEYEESLEDAFAVQEEAVHQAIEELIAEAIASVDTLAVIARVQQHVTWRPEDSTIDMAEHMLEERQIQIADYMENQ